jgi:uncharacterized protein (TIGR00730 family)
MSIQSIAVFCGSQSGLNPKFEADAAALGRLLAQNQINIIYGGGNKGLMAAVANAAMEANGKVIGVIPEVLRQAERQHTGISELIVVDSMHIRKGLMYDKCDAAIILPGGFGTLDELFEMLTWNQLNIHNKHLFILNSDGFYQHLMEHIRIMYTTGFLYSNPDEKISLLERVDDLKAFLI